MKEPIAFLNGRWIAASAAVLPVGDAGFVLGTAVTEQLRTFAGRIFRLEEHLRRLGESLKIVGVELGMTTQQLADVAGELVEKNYALLSPGDDLGLSIFVTPGAYPTYSAGDRASPTVCLHTYRLPFSLWAEKYRSGQALATTEITQVPATCWPPALKCRSRMHYYLADRRAGQLYPRARALLLDCDGFVTEASTANILIYTAGEGLVSPPRTKILHGVSLAVTVELARGLGVRFSERDLTATDVAVAEEVFLTSTPTCLLAACGFNGRAIGEGRPGEFFGRLIAAWSELVGLDIVEQASRNASRE
jgi:branched-chain amino acid aminotransferase